MAEKKVFFKKSIVIGEVTERVQIPKYMLSKKFMFTPEMISTGDLKKKRLFLQ